MKKHAALFLLIAFSDFLLSQQKENLGAQLAGVKEASYYDSARVFGAGEQLLSKVSDEAVRAEVLLYYGNYFFYTQKLDKAQEYFRSSLKRATLADNRHLQLLASIRLTFVEYEKGNKQESTKALDALLLRSRQENDYENSAELLNLIGITKEEANKTREAVAFYLEGLALAEAHDLAYYPAVFRNNLGLVKYYAGQNTDAVEDFTKALRMASREKNKRLLSHIQVNLCIAYVNQNKVRQADSILKEVLGYFRSNHLPQELASAFLNMCNAYKKTKNDEAALAYADSAIFVLKKYSLLNELTKAYLMKAELLFSMGRVQPSARILEQARQLAQANGSLENISSYYFLSYQMQFQKKNYNEALNDYTRYVNTRDSLEHNQTAKLVKEMQLKYDVQKKETELEKVRTKTILLEKSNQEERFLKWLTIASAALLVLIIATILYLNFLERIRQKQQLFSRQLLENIERERLRIARDLHDDIGQSLSIIKSSVQSGNAKAIGAELGRVIEQTREISKNLYPSYLEKIGLVRSVARLVENIQASSQVQCSFEIPEEIESLPMKTKTHLYRILQECTNNTLKHSGATALKISITKNDHVYRLTYQDNGKGMEGAKGTDGMGLLSIRERSKILGGTVSFTDKIQKGFVLHLTFKEEPLI